MGKNTLQTYRDKRNFGKTQEPRDDSSVPVAKQLRFVVQKHDARRLHFDFRLELDGVFKSWAVTRGPSVDPKDKRLAVRVEDHPLAYGDFEGTIPRGQYGGGTVQLWDRGYWIPEPGEKPEAALKEGDLKFSLQGERLHGQWVLARMAKSSQKGKRDNWLLIKRRDADARVGAGDELSQEDASVASGRSLAEIAAGTGASPTPFMRDDGGGTRQLTTATRATRPQARSRKNASQRRPPAAKIPEFIEPQLAKLVDRPPAASGWAHEVKFDGYRAQLRVSGATVSLRTRKGLDWTERFRAVADEARSLPDCLVDGEVVALDSRRIPNFAALQSALSEGKSERLIFFAFDLLFEGGHDLRKLPLEERKARLAALLKGRLGKHIRFVEHFESSADSVLKSACNMDLEGVVSKRLDAPYISGRSGTWTKAKCRAGHEVVVGGYTTDAGALRSLLVGVNKNGHLIYVGKVGTGFGRETVKALVPKLEAHGASKSPFGGKLAPARMRGVKWLKPKLVAEIEFAGWTDAGMVRQAAFKGLRSDKPAAEVVAETVTPLEGDPETALAAKVGRSERAAPAKRTQKRGASRSGGKDPGSSVSISNPDKPLWPDAGDATPVTKLDLAHYYASIGEWLMPHLEGRPCSLVRAPDGIGKQQFFQRHAMKGTSSLLDLVKVTGDREPYLEVNRIEALQALAQIAALELHPWNCAPNAVETPGRLVFDLDPAPDVAFSAVITAALELRTRLEGLGLAAFCKTSGGKGLHVVTPLLTDGRSRLDWAAAKNFTRLVCQRMVSDSPTRYLDNASKAKRTGRIFLDYLRNDRTATAVAPLSPRARKGAPVSMPLEWSEVKSGLDPLAFTLRTAAARLAALKPWADYRKSATSLRSAVKAATR
ncbi:MAG TPA: DNA ligase D [Steroidobacteraceae bacterium]|jgi:bifunctional non-homologous end joining protein LigD